MNSETRLAIVLWSGVLGGAETFSLALCRALREASVDARLLFVGDPQPLLAAAEPSVPFAALQLGRGRHVLRHPRRLAKAVEQIGPEGAVLISPGFLAAALRAGGYRSRVVTVNHGAIIHRARQGWPVRLKRALDSASGFWAADIEVAVSDIVLTTLLEGRLHAPRLVRIYNGVDLKRFRPDGNGLQRNAFTIGWAGRLIPGKGIEDLLVAVSKMETAEVRLRIAGDGPLRSSLTNLAQTLEIVNQVSFEGPLLDMPSFWHGCDVAAMPSNQWVESFGMAAVEAMACGLPVIAARNGALPEVVQEGVTGVLHECGDASGLASAADEYARNDALRRTHSLAARQTCEARFDIRVCASEYRGLFVGHRAAG